METPRVLRLTFELRVPPGLKANIYGNRVEAAVAAITGAVQSLVATVFPWADKLDVAHSWSYEWDSDAKTIQLPATDKNTVDKPAD